MKLVLTILFITTSLVGKSQVGFLFNGWRHTAFVADSALWNFSLTASTQGIAENVAGDPKTGVRSDTHANGWTISSIATANWRPFGGACAAQNISGAGTANTYFTELPTSAFINCWYNYGQFQNMYQVDTPHLRIGNLNPSYEYEIRASGCRGSLSSFDANPMLLYAAGATSIGPSTGLNGSVTTQPNGFVDSGTSQPIKLYPDGSGNIYLWIASNASSDFAVIAVLKVKRTL